MILSKEYWTVGYEPNQYCLEGFRFRSKKSSGTRMLIQGLGCEGEVIWKYFVNDFSNINTSRDLISFNVRGIGNSEGSPQSFEQIIEDTVQVIQMEKPPVQLIGHSLGGLIALRVAEHIPNLIDSVVLVCSNPRYTLKSKSGFVWRANQIEKFRSVSCIFEKVIPRSFSEEFILTQEKDVLEFTKMLNKQNYLNYSKLSRIASEADALQAFDQISVPILMIVGAEDPSITFESSVKFASRINCDVTKVQGSGHNISLENPRALSLSIENFDNYLLNNS